MNIPEIILDTDFACRMAQKSHSGIDMIHAAAIVLYLYLFNASIRNGHDNSRTAGINGILHKFLDNPHGPLHDLAGRNHIGNLCIKLLYSAHHIYLIIDRPSSVFFPAGCV